MIALTRVLVQVVLRDSRLFAEVVRGRDDAAALGVSRSDELGVDDDDLGRVGFGGHVLVLRVGF